MAKNIQEERLRWILPIVNKEIRLCDVIKLCPYSTRSLKRWLKAYREYGVNGLIPKSTKPKANPNETPIRTKERIIELRKETKLCAQKLHWRLKKQEVDIHPRTIGKIIKQEGLVRRYRIRKLKYKYIKVPLAKGEFVKLGRLDYVVILMVVIIGVFWQTTGDPITANLLLQLILLISFYPTVRGLLRRELREKPLPWNLAVISYVLLISAILIDWKSGAWLELIHPIVNGIIGNGSVALIANIQKT